MNKETIVREGEADWLSEKTSVIKKYNNTIHNSMNLSNEKTLSQASKKSNEKEVYPNLKDDREVRNPNFILGQLVRTADIKRDFN